MKILKNAVLAMFSIGLAAIVPKISATPLAPGSSAWTALESNPLGSATLVDSWSGTFSALTISGTLDSYVFSDPSNPLGGYTFAYQVNNSKISPDAVSGVGIDGFAGFKVDAAETPGGGTFASSVVSRGVNGSTVTFDFSNPPIGFGQVNPGESSYWLVVRTDATAYQTGSAGVRDGSGVSTTALRPGVAGVPDGGSTILLLSAGLGLAEIIRRRLKPAV